MEMTGASEAGTVKTKVLVVDDERLIADTLAIILKQARFEVCVAYSGEAAAETLDTFAPDIVVSDVMMIGLSGIELAMLVRDRRPECRLILMSGQAATVDLVGRAHALGYRFEVHAKPIHPQVLLAQLGKPFMEQNDVGSEGAPDWPLGRCAETHGLLASNEKAAGVPFC